MTCAARSFCMASNHSYRELRPASDRDAGADPLSHMPLTADPSRPSLSSSSSSSSSSASTSTRKPTRRNVWVACESCKKRKTKCTADRPKCTSCAARGFDCHYNADPSESRNASLKRKHADLEHQNGCLKQFLVALRSLPEPHAFEVLRKIRSGASVEDIVRQIEGGYLLLQLSERAVDVPPSCDMSTITAMPPTLLTPEHSSADSATSRETSLDSSRASSMSQPRTVDEGAEDRRSASETRQRSQRASNPQSIANLLL